MSTIIICYLYGWHFSSFDYDWVLNCYECSPSSSFHMTCQASLTWLVMAHVSHASVTWWSWVLVLIMMSLCQLQRLVTWLHWCICASVRWCSEVSGHGQVSSHVIERNWCLMCADEELWLWRSMSCWLIVLMIHVCTQRTDGLEFSSRMRLLSCHLVCLTLVLIHEVL